LVESPRFRPVKAKYYQIVFTWIGRPVILPIQADSEHALRDFLPPPSSNVAVRNFAILPLIKRLFIPECSHCP
jgi:hypothetical protein